MRRRVFIIHGYNGSSGRGWKLWLAEQLRERAFDVCAPDMPTPAHPKKDAWVAKMQEVVGEPRATDVFVGHSLGTIAIVRYLESLKPGQSVGKVILVAGFFEDLGDEEMDEIRTFVDGVPDWKKIRAACPSFSVIHSDNDDVIPLPFAQRLANNLGVPLEVFEGYGHFSYGDGVMELPLVLAKIH